MTPYWIVAGIEFSLGYIFWKFHETIEIPSLGSILALVLGIVFVVIGAFKYDKQKDRLTLAIAAMIFMCFIMILLPEIAKSILHKIT